MHPDVLDRPDSNQLADRSTTTDRRSSIVVCEAHTLFGPQYQVNSKWRFRRTVTAKITVALIIDKYEDYVRCACGYELVKPKNPTMATIKIF